MNRNNSRLRTLIACANMSLMLVMAPCALAEKADREKPINIAADRGFEDNKKQEAVFEGNVVLTQGSLKVEANRIVVHRDKNGFDYAIATGSPAKFRQKRDGFDEYVDGQAQRIEFDGRQEIVQFFDKAQLTRGQDEITSNYIQYNSRTESFQASSQKDASTGGDGGRVKATLQPKAKGPLVEQNPLQAHPSEPAKPQ